MQRDHLSLASSDLLGHHGMMGTEARSLMRNKGYDGLQSDLTCEQRQKNTQGDRQRGDECTALMVWYDRGNNLGRVDLIQASQADRHDHNAMNTRGNNDYRSD